jgi:hypothetical protein
LIPGKPQYRATLRQSAALALLLLSAARLAACGGFAATSETPPATEIAANYRQVIANRLRSTFKDYASYDLFQISEPRSVHAVQGWSWVVCVRFSDHGSPRSYALFVQSHRVVESRYAVRTDGCDIQAYAPFDEMTGSGLPPLH